MDTVIEILKAIVPSLMVGIVLGIWNRKQNKRNSEADAKEKNAMQKEVLQLDLLVATSQLSYAVAMAKKRGSVNGEMEDAIAQYNKAMGKFRRFEREELARYQLD